MRSRAVAGLFVCAVAAACDANFAFDQRDAATAGPCALDTDCPRASLQCDIPSGACVPCTDDAFCTTAGFPRCDTALHICVECGSSQDCQAGWQCAESHRCMPPCTGSADCSGSTPYCDIFNGVCFACNDLFPCSSGVCDEESGRCVECLIDAQCAGRRCQRALGKCVDCVLSAQCPTSAPVCDPATWSCVN